MAKSLGKKPTSLVFAVIQQKNVYLTILIGNMDKIISYLGNNPKYAWVLAVSFAIIAISIALIFILRSQVNKKRAAKNDNSSLAHDKPTDEQTNGSPSENLSANISKPEEREKKSEILKTQSSPKTDEAAAIKINGDWVITEENGKFTAALVSDGLTLLTSETYSSLSGVKSGIDTLKNNLQTENYAINVNAEGNFYFKVFSTANRLLCKSQGFSTRERCENAFFKCKRASENAAIITKT